MALILTIIFGLTTVLGVVVSVFFGLRAAKLQKRLKSFDWEEVLVGVNDLAARVKTSGVDLIFAVSGRGAILSYFLADDLPSSPPVVPGIQQWTDEQPQLLEQIQGYELVETGRSRVQIPLGLKDLTDRKLLIVDDLAFSGDALAAIKAQVVAWGFDGDQTKTLTLVATNVAIKNEKAPDFYWQAVDEPGFFPWGRAR